MGMTTSLVALALWGSDPVPPPAQPAAGSVEPIVCEVQVMTIEGLGWRDAASAQLKPAARQGTATIWTADRSLKAKLEQRGVGKSIKAPKVATNPNAIASVNSDKITDYIRHYDRIVDSKGQTALKPETATVREGFSVIFSGQRFDQGVMAKVKFAESHIGSMHTIVLDAGKIVFEGSLGQVGGQIARAIATGTTPGDHPQIQIPEVFLSEIQGEWLVPNDGILLISTGVNTMADAAGKAVVQERLAILDFGAPAECVAPTQASVLLPACRVDGDPAIAMENAANLSMPRVPDRSYPEARDKDGNVIELPPLPEAYASADLNQIEPGSVLASAQTLPTRRPGAMTADPALARTSFEPIPESEVAAGLSYYHEGSNPPAPGLAAVVESFLRKGMGRKTADPALARTSFEPIPADFQELFPNRVFKDIVTNLDEQPCDAPACPAAGCPFSAEGCHDAQPEAPAGQPAQVTMGVSVQNATGTCIFDYQGKLSTVFRNPGTPEVQYIPLTNGLSLQLQAKVVATPPTRDVAAGPAVAAPR